MGLEHLRGGSDRGEESRVVWLAEDEGLLGKISGGCRRVILLGNLGSSSKFFECRLEFWRTR